MAGNSAPAPDPADCRILITSHSHPALSNGGAEISAFQLFSSLCGRAGFEASFLGSTTNPLTQKLGATISQPFSHREYLYSVGAFDWFKFANRDPMFPSEFRKLISMLEPEILHFHHYANFGVEAFLHAKRTLPDCKIVLTLHEYLAVCHHYGQMIRSDHHTLCYESGPLRCNGCFKDIPPSEFFLRELYIKRFFGLVDHFIAPSAFLAGRYTAWGIPQERITVIENAIPNAPAIEVSLDLSDDTYLRVGFFGQISLLKGINVLFDAARILDQEKENHIVIEIFGDYRSQPAEFQKDFTTRLAAAGFNVKFHGPYDHERVDKLIRSVDVVVLPSIWWENSPVVIQEALRNRTPIVCSDIGGMAEKVVEGRDGFHFPAGNAVALAALLRRLAGSRDRLEAVSRSIQAPAAIDLVVAQHEELYRRLLS